MEASALPTHVTLAMLQEYQSPTLCIVREDVLTNALIGDTVGAQSLHPIVVEELRSFVYFP